MGNEKAIIFWVRSKVRRGNGFMSHAAFRKRGRLLAKEDAQSSETASPICNFNTLLALHRRCAQPADIHVRYI